MSRTFYEFFAGGGMARAGLGVGWKCLLANDLDRKKAETYKLNWGSDGLIADDIQNILPEAMPGKPDLVWGSFPCQDLSLAGTRAGLGGSRSSTFWALIRHIQTLKNEARAPALIALENVPGTVTSNDGKDFIAICQALADLGYKAGAVVVDAAHFVPHSRPRLFIIGLRNDLEAASCLTSIEPKAPWHTQQLITAYEEMPQSLRSNWQWWNLPVPPKRTTTFADLVEENPESVEWDKPNKTAALILAMNKVHQNKVATAIESNTKMVGALFKRTRQEHGIKEQRVEIRFDDIAGCLRTPTGGSSRQLLMIVDGENIRSRLISPRETARLMGLPDTYQLPKGRNEAFHLTGDGVVVPVVRYITKHLFEKLILDGN